MNSDSETGQEDIRIKLNKETAKLGWHELERHFAAGNVVFVAPGLDLIEVAYEVSRDNKIAIQGWLAAQQVGPASDELAASWHQQKAELWVVVVAPLVLVQEVKELQEQELQVKPMDTPEK